MGKSKPKIQTHVHRAKKRLIVLNALRFIKLKSMLLSKKLHTHFKKVIEVLRRYKYFVRGVLAVSLIILVWFLSQTWLVRTSFSQVITFSKVSVLGKNVGNLNDKQLKLQIADLKNEFDNKNITLINGNDKWVFKPTKIGVSFDSQSTVNSVLRLNNMSVVDKYKLLTGGISSVIEPKILVNNETCTKALSVVPDTQIDSTDAAVYFENGLKIKPDQSGTKFNAVMTCRELPKLLAANKFKSDIYLDIKKANITKSELESKLPQIQSMVGAQLSLKNGNFDKSFMPEQLFAMIEITKPETEIQVAWSSDKIDAAIDDIAANVNTYDAIPSLGGCQYLSSSGGNWLDKTATKKIFTDLYTNSSRNYNLPISHHDSVIGDIKPINQGTKGTIYLTYDDGLTYGDRIMNLASCYGIKVTFFELGSRVSTDAAGLRRAIAEGHAVQSHGYEHAAYDYGSRSYDWQVNDMAQSITAITNVTGVRPTYFRPPGGNKSSSTYDAAAVNGLKIIMWGDASRDSAPTGVTSSLTCANVLAGAYPGASVLMHSTKQSTAEALPCIAEGLAARGYNMQALR